MESRAGVYEIPYLDCNKNMCVKLAVILVNEFTSTEEI